MERDWNSAFEGHFSKGGEIRLVAGEYVGAAGDDAETRRLVLVEKQMGYGVGYVERQADFGIGEASSAVRRIHDESE